MGSPVCAPLRPSPVKTIEDVTPCVLQVKRQIESFTSVCTAEAISCKDD